VFDVLLRGGWVVDGTGAPPWRADLAVTGDRIASIGHLAEATAPVEIDAAGRYLMPGFVDTHVHADASAATSDVQLAALRQGVTTLLLGQDGVSFAPASAATIAAVSQYFGPVNGPCPAELADGCSVADLLACYDRAGALNVGYLAPAGTIRAEVMGYDPAPAGPGQPGTVTGPSAAWHNRLTVTLRQMPGPASRAYATPAAGRRRGQGCRESIGLSRGHRTTSDRAGLLPLPGLEPARRLHARERDSGRRCERHLAPRAVLGDGPRHRTHHMAGQVPRHARPATRP